MLLRNLLIFAVFVLSTFSSLSALAFSTDMGTEQAIKTSGLEDVLLKDQFNLFECKSGITSKLNMLNALRKGRTADDQAFFAKITQDGTKLICAHLYEMNKQGRVALSDSAIEAMDAHGKGATGQKILAQASDALFSEYNKMDRELDALFDKYRSEAKNSDQGEMVKNLEAQSNKYLMTPFKDRIVKMKTLALTENISLARGLVKSISVASNIQLPMANPQIQQYQQ